MYLLSLTLYNGVVSLVTDITLLITVDLLYSTCIYCSFSTEDLLREHLTLFKRQEQQGG